MSFGHEGEVFGEEDRHQVPVLRPLQLAPLHARRSPMALVERHPRQLVAQAFIDEELHAALGRRGTRSSDRSVVPSSNLVALGRP